MALNGKLSLLLTAAAVNELTGTSRKDRAVFPHLLFFPHWWGGRRKFAEYDLFLAIFRLNSGGAVLRGEVPNKKCKLKIVYGV